MHRGRKVRVREGRVRVSMRLGKTGGEGNHRLRGGDGVKREEGRERGPIICVSSLLDLMAPLDTGRGERGE